MNNRNYLYILNYPQAESSICKLEMKSFFNKENQYKYIFSEYKINESRSPFIKQRIDVLYEEEDLEKLYNNIEVNNLSADEFKVEYIRVDDKTLPFLKATYEERLTALREIGVRINGNFNINNPKELFGLTYIENKWVFGKLYKNDFLWHEHDNKPNSYSNSIGLKTARSLVNIAVGRYLDLKVVDPCAGIGTVVLEGLSMGIDIKGYEILPHIAEKARENLKYFNLEENIECVNMHNTSEHFDVCILDLPYGLFTKATEEDQSKLILSAKKISDKVIIISFSEKEEELRKIGFNIVSKCTVSKNRFTRRIYVCE